VLPMDRETGNARVDDPRFKLLSFTGSPDIGWKTKAQAGMKQVVLELGAMPKFGSTRIRMGAFSYAGQVCILVSRVFVHEARYEEVKAKLVATATSLRTGDPFDSTSELGPMIGEKAASRAQQ